MRRRPVKGPLTMGICGRSCSGKGLVCEAIANVNREVLYLNSDVFFKSQTPCRFTKHNRNGDGECWECSKSIWFDRLINCIKAIKNG
jgi:uridine kinase